MATIPPTANTNQQIISSVEKAQATAVIAGLITIIAVAALSGSFGGLTEGLKIGNFVTAIAGGLTFISSLAYLFKKSKNDSQPILDNISIN